MTSISVFGLGYVGVVSSGCLARSGLQVIGVDVNPDKVRAINEGRSPIVEDQIGDFIGNAVGAGRLRATTDVEEAIRSSELSLLVVGTPSRPNGSVDFSALERVCASIGQALRAKRERHLVVVRSTVLPGTVRGLVVPALERASGKAYGPGFGVCVNPEFLREASAVRDYYDPPFTLVGADDRADAERAAALYQGLSAPVVITTVETAEMAKYVCNAFHALKVTFANEIGALARTMGVDSHEVMQIVCRDTKLNISPVYLRPGFAFGGSCLPKDVRALDHKARERDLELPLLRAILGSNRAQVDRALEIVWAARKKKVGVLGLSFKAGTDDLRESPLVTLTEAMVGKGLDVRIYDRSIELTRLVGANRAYIEKELPHLSRLLTSDLEAVVEHGELLVIGNAAPEFSERLPALCRPGQVVLDLVRIEGLRQRAGIEYHGITW